MWLSYMPVLFSLLNQSRVPPMMQYFPPKVCSSTYLPLVWLLSRLTPSSYCDLVPADIKNWKIWSDNSKSYNLQLLMLHFCTVKYKWWKWNLFVAFFLLSDYKCAKANLYFWVPWHHFINTILRIILLTAAVQEACRVKLKTVHTISHSATAICPETVPSWTIKEHMKNCLGTLLKAACYSDRKLRKRNIPFHYSPPIEEDWVLPLQSALMDSSCPIRLFGFTGV